MDLHPEALHQALQVYGELLVSSDIAAIMIKREERLSLRYQAELAALRQDQIYGRNWSGLFRLLIDLLKKGGRP